MSSIELEARYEAYRYELLQGVSEDGRKTAWSTDLYLCHELQMKPRFVPIHLPLRMACDRSSLFILLE